MEPPIRDICAVLNRMRYISQRQGLQIPRGREANGADFSTGDALVARLLETEGVCVTRAFHLLLP